MPQIEGKNWNAEVVDRSFKREKIRNEFYEKLAKLKLGIEANPETVLGNPSASGLKTHEELASASEFSHETEKGSTLSAVLHDYFKENLGITDAKTRGREVALSLYALTRQKDTKGRAINVDYLNLKWKIEIKTGQLFISDQKGEKIVDGAYLRKRTEGSAAVAAAAAPAESVGNLSEAANRFVTRIRERSKEKRSLNEILGKVQEGLDVGKKKIDAIIQTATPEEIADSTNAWRAWTRDGFLKGPENLELRKSLQKFIFDSEEEIPPAHKKYARQFWRTEMVSHISQKLQGTSRTDKAIVMEKIMGAMRVTDSENEPAEALKSAMLLDPKIKDREVRQGLARKMGASDKHGGVAEIPAQFTGFVVREVKVVVGGDFISIPLEQTANFKFKHMVPVESENRIYAQMENGCMGNLVIIEGQSERPEKVTGSIERPGTITGPVERPGTITGPVQRPGSVTGPVERPGTVTGPVERPGSVSGPVQRPGTVTGPVERPGTITGPVERPGTITGPVQRPGSVIGGVERPGSVTGPVQRPGDVSGPVERPGSATGPVERPGTVTGPVERPGGTTGQVERPGSVTGSVDRPGSTTGPVERPGTATGTVERPGSAVGGVERPATTTAGPVERPGAAAGPIERPNPATGQVERPEGATGPVQRPAPAQSPGPSPTPAPGPKPDDEGEPVKPPE